MEFETAKPPWMRIQWFVSPRKDMLKEGETYGPRAEQGDWVEDQNPEIEVLKESIQPYDKTELWDLAKRITNPYELIHTHSTRLALPKSICCLHPLSRSFFKMIEMLTQLQFFERHKVPKLRSLHICEGPGGFVEAFHYLADTHKRLIQSSHAMTLKSTHQIIPGWRRATQFLQRHPNISVLYGPTRTGDIYEPVNQEECAKAVTAAGAHLVTADGGFDFSDDFHAQEKNILRLLVSSSIILLESVAIEGDIVLKVFDCNGSVTRDLIAILASCFHQWTLYKPVTSRPCNSEWYFLGKCAMRDRRAAIERLKEVRDGLAAAPPIQYGRLLAVNPIDEQLKNLQNERVQTQKRALVDVLTFCKSAAEISHGDMWVKQNEKCVDWCSSFRMPVER
jgi:23S rRNA U2552 (ribose-2'-O)-methylase RlmE/FtsJ